MAWKIQWDKTAICIGLTGVTLLALRRAVLYFTTKCPSRALLLNKTVIITGANCGIGYETALDLARRKARVILACRNVGKAEKAANKIRKKSGNNDIIVKKLDLASLNSVREFCADIKETREKVDVLINNAGVMKCPYSLTEDGFETHYAVNHLGNFLLTNLLKDSLYKAPGSRVVFVSSSLHRFGSINLENLNSEVRYKTGKPYNDSKLMNILFAREFHKRASNEGRICVYSIHPGMVRTRLARHSIIFNNYFRIFAFPVFAVFYSLFTLLVKSAREGCQTVVYCAVAPELDGESDCYYGNMKKELWSGPSCNTELGPRIWDVSAELTGLQE